MLQNLSVTPSRRSLEFGIYRDGDNNLDAIQESTLAQALRTSAADSRVELPSKTRRASIPTETRSSRAIYAPNDTSSPTAASVKLASVRPTT